MSWTKNCDKLDYGNPDYNKAITYGEYQNKVTYAMKLKFNTQRRDRNTWDLHSLLARDSTQRERERKKGQWKMICLYLNEY